MGMAGDTPLRRQGHVIAVSNMKGGAGKSTLAVNLACALASLELRVALIDSDEQGSTVAWTTRQRLPVRCVHLPLRRIEELDPWLATLLTVRGGHDVTLVDFPAGMAPALAATFLVASLVLIPTSPHAIEVAATRRMLRHVARVRAERPDDPPGVLIVPNRVQDLGSGLEGYRDRLAVLGEELTPPLRHDGRFDQAFARGDWVGAIAPGSSAHNEIMALAGLVRDRLAKTVPAPWPPASGLAASLAPSAPVTRPVRAAAPRSVGPDGRPAPGTPSGQSKRGPAPPPRVHYLDEVAARARQTADRERSLLVRWAARLTRRPTA
jgi:chromosome partitioning protein